ncbi:MAG: META domain-containing protein [Planctomycetes bacterium]|nr:META domain-containing protein [Planctomycetota bacterium]
MRRLALLAASAAFAFVASCTSTPAAPLAPLVGTEWTLVELEGASGMHALDAPGPRPHLVLGADAAAAGEAPHLLTVVGFAGVNTFRGVVTLSGADGFACGPLATTRKAGPPPSMQLENDVLKLLGATTRYRLDGDGLTLLAPDGALTFLPAAAE